MPKVIADITMSLDGYVTGPGADVEHGLGDAPELHAWVFGQDPVDADVLEGATAASGAVVMGRRLFDTVDAPHGWSKDMGYGGQQVGSLPSSSSPTPRRRRSAWSGTWVCDSRSWPIWTLRSIRLGPPRRMAMS